MAANGFGWNGERTAREVDDLQKRFPLLADSPEVFTRWLDLVKQLPVTGKRVHDARLVAVLQAHAVENLITFNTSDFAVFHRFRWLTQGRWSRRWKSDFFHF